MRNPALTFCCVWYLVCSRVFEADAGPEASDMSVTASAVELLAEAKSGLETARDDLDPMRDEVLAAFDAPLDASRKHVHAAAARVKKMRKVVQNKKGANKSKTVFRAQKCKSAKVSQLTRKRSDENGQRESRVLTRTRLLCFVPLSSRRLPTSALLAPLSLRRRMNWNLMPSPSRLA